MHPLCHHNNIHRHHWGFTLMEVMIVVVLLGVLVTLALPAYRTMLLQGRLEGVVPYLTAIAAKERIYHSRRGIYFTARDEQDLEDTLGLDLRDAADFCFVVVSGAGNYLSASGNPGGGDYGDAEFEVWAVLRYEGEGNDGVSVQGVPTITCVTADEKHPAQRWVLPSNQATEPASEGRVVVLRYPPPAFTDTVRDPTPRTGRSGVYLDWINGISFTDALQ